MRVRRVGADSMPPGEQAPGAPLPLPRNATVALLGDATDRSRRIHDVFSAAGREVACSPLAAAVDRADEIAHDVVIVGAPIHELLALAPRLERALDGVVLVYTAVLESANAEAPQTDSAALALAQALPRARVVGALQQFDADHLALIALGVLDSDAPVVADDREAADLVEALLDEVPGLCGVYSGPLRNAAAVEGIRTVLLTVSRTAGRPAGFRLDPARGLVFLHGRPDRSGP